jgi:hypothetical protein
MHRPPSDQGQRDVPLQNRVTPFGEIIAHPARGLLMGNRGILHDGERRLGRARWRHPHWVTCLLVFRGRWREVMRPGHYTELFFLDEATALAAGTGRARNAGMPTSLPSATRGGGAGPMAGGAPATSTGRCTWPGSRAARDARSCIATGSRHSRTGSW